MSKIRPSPILEKNFFPAGNMPEIAVFADFRRTFSYLSLFFHAKTLLITMPTIKHGSIVNKTDFWSRNFLKIAGTADFRRKNGISWISRVVLYIFSWNFTHRCKMAMSKMFFWHFLEILPLVFSDFFAQRWILGLLKTWSSPIFEKIFFFGRKCRKYAGNRRFCRFSSDFFLIFRCFFLKFRTMM